MRVELPRYVYGQVWADNEGRGWRVVKHPDLKIKMLQLAGQEDQPLYHTMEHVEAEFGPMTRSAEAK